MLSGEQLPVQLVGRARFGVQLHGERGDLDVPAPGPVDELGDLVVRAGGEPAQRGQRRLHRPAEPCVVGPAVDATVTKRSMSMPNDGTVIASIARNVVGVL